MAVRPPRFSLSILSSFLSSLAIPLPKCWSLPSFTSSPSSFLHLLPRCSLREHPCHRVNPAHTAVGAGGATGGQSRQQLAPISIHHHMHPPLHPPGYSTLKSRFCRWLDVRCKSYEDSERRHRVSPNPLRVCTLQPRFESVPRSIYWLHPHYHFENQDMVSREILQKVISLDLICCMRGV